MIKDDKDLCQWLRDTSSGIYRNSALAADRIEEMSKELGAYRDMFTTADNVVVAPGDKVWVMGSRGVPEETTVDHPKTSYMMFSTCLPLSCSCSNKDFTGL